MIPNFSGGWASNLSKVEAYIAVEMNPSPLFVEESVKDNLSYRSIVVWRGGKLYLSDKTLVKKFWHGSVGHDSCQGDGQKGVEAQIAEKNKDIRSKDEIIRMKDILLEARDRLISSLEEKVRCKDCHKVPNSAPLYNCPQGHTICSSCHKGVTTQCPSCHWLVGSRSISLIGLTVIENIKHSCPYPNCAERMDFANIAEHKQICSLRTLACPATNCKTAVTYQKLLEHIKECKYSHYQRNARTISDTNETTKKYVFDSEEDLTKDLNWQMNTIRWKSKYFFFTIKTNGKNKMTNAYVQMLGSSDDCLKYRVRLSIRNKEGLDFVSHYDHPFSVYMEEEEKVDGGLVITTKNLTKACKPPADDSDKYEFAVRIKFKEI